VNREEAEKQKKKKAAVDREYRLLQEQVAEKDRRIRELQAQGFTS